MVAFIPALRVLPPRSSSAVSEVVDFAAAIGQPFDDHQQDYAEAVYGWQDGTWAADTVALIEPRQNGKTQAGQVFALADAFLFGVEQHTWTAHLFETARKSFNWMSDLIESRDELISRVRRRRVRKSNGNMGWTLLSGADTAFRARSKGGGRGLSGNVVTLDEGLILPSSALAALIPTLSAKPHTQIRLLSSQGDDSPEADMLRGLRDLARAAARDGGDAGRLAYIEAAAPFKECLTPRCFHLRGTRGCALDDRELWRAANYAMHAGRMTEAAVARERKTITVPLKFAMERMGWWIDPPPISEDERITPAQWNQTSSATELLVDGATTVAFVDVAWDRSWSAIAFAQRVEGTVVAQLVGYEKGVQWVEDFLRAELENMDLKATYYQRMTPASSLFEEIEAKRDALAKTCKPWNAGDLANACGQLVNLLPTSDDDIDATDEAVAAGDRFLHTDDGPVTLALTAQATRQIGDAWVWDRKVPMEKAKVDLSPLIAVTGAVGAVMRLPKPKPFKVH